MLMSSDNQSDLIVVKVGGSLYDLPDLGSRLSDHLKSLDAPSLMIVPGGGVLADEVRDLDARHQLGEEAAHWLALRTLGIAAHFLTALLPGSVIVDHPEQTQRRIWAVLDPYAFARWDQGRAGELPHCWDVTSDSIAARAAHVAKARRLVLLKSVTIPNGTNWNEAAWRGWVDAHFVEVIGDLLVESVNLRVL
jgi:aspartokinase-like uncharacterized kinase